MDVLDTFPIIRVATAYITPEGNKKVTTFPADLNELEKYTVEYVDFEGWQTSTQGMRSWEELPSQAKKYIALIESFIGVKVCPLFLSHLPFQALTGTGDLCGDRTRPRGHDHPRMKAGSSLASVGRASIDIRETYAVQ